MLSFGIDSSNYRSSAAVLFEDNSFINERKLLFVESGKCGLRQSDAVFLHTKQLPDIICNALSKINTKEIGCIGVSTKPRPIERSYMPCFLSGAALAKILSQGLNVPLFEFSHQEGHIAAALLSSGRIDLFDKKFIAFHLSGGTTEAVLVSPSENRGFSVEIAGKTLDISVGQVIDRVGVMLGLDFPSGPALEKLANQGAAVKNIKPCIKGTDCALSGVENICKNLFEQGETAENIAATALEYVIKTVLKMAISVFREYGELPLIFSGGVAANQKLKEVISENLCVDFASPELSGDNAVGIALLAKRKAEN